VGLKLWWRLNYSKYGILHFLVSVAYILYLLAPSNSLLLPCYALLLMNCDWQKDGSYLPT